MIFDTLLRPDATTRMSTRPNLSTAAFTILSQFSSELGRSAIISALAPSFSHSAATFLSSSALLAASTTLAPAPASVFAASAPKAPDAPVMMAVLPLMSNSARGLFRNASDMVPSRILVHGRACPGHLRFACSVAAKSWMPEQVQARRLCASLGRIGHRHHDRAHFVAAIDDLTRFIWFDHAGIVGLQNRLLAVDNDGQFTAQHEIDLFGRRSVRSGAATRQKVRVTKDETFGAAGLRAEQA